MLQQMLDSPDAELLALYGRRRVGKTYLIVEFFEPRADLFFAVSGVKDAPIARQLTYFRRELERVFYGGAPLPRLRSWDEAFLLLSDAVQDRVIRQPGCQVVLFLDELPWMATPRSNLIQILDHYWNTRLSRQPTVRLVVCGSAASWILDRLIHARGGLHNRITRRIRLEPFTLAEARELFVARRLSGTPAQVLEHYMAVGGVPHYLKQMVRGRSAAQNIAQTCFDSNGVLVDEFPRLFASLFAESEAYEQIVRAIARKQSGVTRNEIIAITGLPSGGRLGRRLRELEEAGFIASLPPYRAKKKNTLYRLIDEYCWFYLRWIEKAPRGILARGGEDYWITKSATPAHRAWAGYAFESLCLKHAHEIRRALGIAGVASEVATWRHVPRGRSAHRRGAQVDLLFDRDDGVNTLCELKYSTQRFKVSRSYARELQDKITVFEEQTRTAKDVQLALITTRGLQPNSWSADLVDAVVTVDRLFG